MLALQLFEHWTASDFKLTCILWGFFTLVVIAVALIVRKSDDIRYKRPSYFFIAAFFIFMTLFFYTGIDEMVRNDVEFRSRAEEERTFAEQTFTQELFPDITWHGDQINFTTGQCYVSVFVTGAHMQVVVLDPDEDNTSHSQVLPTAPSESVSFVQRYCSPR